MVLLEDTRNKIGKHKNIHAYCNIHNIEIVRQCLSVGDYMLPDGNISVDTKSTLEEISQNLMNRSDSARFWREVRRAYQQGIQLVVLVESGPSVLTINDVPKWKSKYSKVTGRTIQTEMIRLEQAYGVRWVFCSKRSTAKRIIEILDGKY